MRATIQHVAERAGVSSMTVSNVLRGRAGEAGDETRARVLAAVRELEYIPIRATKQSRHVETHVIGVVFDEIDATDDWGLMTLRGLREGALQHGYDLLLLLRPQPDWSVGREEAQYLDRRSDGLIFVAPHERQGLLSSLVSNEIPVVACHNVDVPSGVAHVVADNFNAARVVTEHLIECGHRDIAHWPGELTKSYFRQRRDGFCHAMKSAGLDEALVCQPQGHSDWPQRANLQKIMRQKVTAIVAGNDYLAIRLWNAAREAGVRVPEELSIIGIDGVREATEANLTTFHFDHDELGKAAIDSFIRLKQGADWRTCHQIIDGRLIERGSVRSLES